MTTINTTTILFMGSPEFSCPTLETLIQLYPKSNLHVCTQPDKPSGRNKKITPTPIKTLALHHQKPVYTPHTKHELTTCVQSINPDLIIVVAYGFILEKAITDHYLCINIHGSLLPKYRGATPMQAALLNQDNETGITLIKMDEGCDTGPILAKRSCPIQDNDYINTLHDKRFKVLEAHIDDNNLVITTIKPEGKQAMSWKDACLGYPKLTDNLYI